MNIKVEKLLKHQGDNYILPFFWQHGEDEQTLRTYMKVIDEANIKAVCGESTTSRLLWTKMVGRYGYHHG